MNPEDKKSSQIVQSIQHKMCNKKFLLARQNENELKLILQSAQRDIVVHLRGKQKLEGLNVTGKSIFRKFPTSFTDNEFIIPIMIFEVKYKDVNTHAIHQYSEIARMIKNIFPFAKYNLLLLDMRLGNNVDRIYMAAKYFDEIIYKPDYSQKPKETIKAVWNEIDAHINYLREDKFYGLGEILK